MEYSPFIFDDNAHNSLIFIKLPIKFPQVIRQKNIQWILIEYPSE